MLSHDEFNVLRFCSEQASGSKISQRMIAQDGGFSVGKANRLVADLISDGLLDKDYRITKKGLETLAPYKVESAIILAAGMGTRLFPLSTELPKALVSVKGETLIERQIVQLQEAGVPEIVVVIGYMMEKFFYLREKYGVTLVVNPEFATKNTHSSVYVAREHVSNTYIITADNYYPENLFHAYEYRSFYNAIFLKGESYVERALLFDSDGLVYDTEKPARDQWILYGHAYWDRSFSDKFVPILESYFDVPGTENMYWENVWAENVSVLPLYAVCCDEETILEFDSMEEIRAFDPDFIASNPISIFDNICKVLDCELLDIKDIEIMSQGLNNQSFSFTAKGERYVYRHPGENAAGVIDRNHEAKCLRAAKELGIDDSLIYIDENEGWKISKFINVIVDFDFTNPAHSELLAKQLKKLHDANVVVGFKFDYKEEGELLIEQVRHSNSGNAAAMLEQHEMMEPIFRFLESDPWQVSLCHNDLYAPNLLLEDIGKLYVIDWEFSGDSDIGYDICKLFSLCEPAEGEPDWEYPFDEIDPWLVPYYGRKTTLKEKTHLMACAACIYYYWYIWALYAEGGDKNVSEYLITWHDRMVRYRARALALINGKEKD